MAMTYLQKVLSSLFLTVCLARGLHAQNEANSTAATDPCEPNPCGGSQYCAPHTPTGEDSSTHLCIENGYRAGHCSLNAYLSCDEYATCTDAADGKSFICECQTDAVGDGYKVETGGTGCTLSFKPCTDDKDCPQYGFCNTTTYKCACNEGFRGNGRNCTDINECDSLPCDEHAACNNFPGGFMCTCDAINNFVGDGFTCTFFCYNNNDCDVPRATCNDNNECECKPGYDGDGLQCVDIDECANPSANDCGATSDCVNTDGSFECKCKNGYSGDGYNCTELPRSCLDIPKFSSGKTYVIDPDFTGSANAFEVICDRINGVIVTKVPPTNTFPVAAPEDKTPVTITYNPDKEDIKPLLEGSDYCYQDISFACYEGYSLFPGFSWFDAYDQQHRNLGSTQDQSCACGEVGLCPSCYCDGTQKGSLTTDEGRIVDKSTLPVVRLEFGGSDAEKGRIDVGSLICADRPIDLPKDCHEAKFSFNIEKNGPLYIDVDGRGGLAPFLVFCDMESFKHVGVTELPPDSPIYKPTEVTGKTVGYVVSFPQIQGLISGSMYCSQYVEFTCQNSRLGPGAGYVTVTSSERRLDYFPGADGVQDSCGCGATQSCDSAQVKCNCNIEDGQERKDFGLIVNKQDLPVVRVTAELGDARSGAYSVGNLRCGQKQFGIEPNCEKYRAIGTTESYTYFIDPDGPGNLDPFLVECQFLTKPPQGSTIVHHDKEGGQTIGSNLFNVLYLLASDAQIAALKDRSTFCTQEIKFDCKQVSLQIAGGGVTFTGATDQPLPITDYLDTCGLSGTGCNCDALTGTASDNGTIADMSVVPVDRLDFSSLLSKLTIGKELVMSLGPLVCSEVFPTCAALKGFIDGGQSVEGEAAVVDGFFTVDPDGPGGEEPFEVVCRFPATIVNVGPATEGLNPDPNDPNKPQSICYDIGYTNENGDSISPAQISALVQTSGKCRQELVLECQNAPVSGKVNFTSCDGKAQPGWAGSFGEDTCACGVNGNCDGGPDANCNCDMADDQLRSDGGNIISTDRLPVCQICLAMEPVVPGAGSAATTSLLRYKLGELKCDGGQGTKQNCQEARRQAGNSVQAEQESSVTISSTENVPVGCKFYPDPPVGILVVKPQNSVFPPQNDSSTTDVNVIYITINITLIRDTLEANEYCSQNVFVFCGSDAAVQLGGEFGWYTFDGQVIYDWTELDVAGDAVQKACTDNQALCDRCGQPRGFQLTKTEYLPVARIVLSDPGVTVVVGDAECLDIKQSCQHILDGDNRYVGFFGGNNYVIDPDGVGPIDPFAVLCEFDQENSNGVTEIPVTGEFVTNVVVTNANDPANFYAPVEYLGATPEQIDALSQISEFCWQGVKFECRYSPLVSREPPSSYYTLYNGGQSKSFGAGPETEFPGCACGQTGTCVSSAYNCNCDALGRMGVDQGAVTNQDALPITGFYVGGQIDVSFATASVTNVRCSSKPVDPPKDCAEAFELKSQYGIDYAYSSEYLISPDPDNVAPFMVRCDFELSPGNGVTVIKPNFPTDNPLEHRPGESTDIPYHGPTEEQIVALVQQSAYCYQGVKFDCFATTFLGEGAYFLGGGSRVKRVFWGGGGPVDDGRGGVCACGEDKSCGGLDSASGQRTRRCNCDYGDETFRSDAGIIDIKEALPLTQMWLGRYAQFQGANLTIGDLYCSQSPLKFDECTLGFQDCHPLAKCVDMDDGYRCVCPPGWNGKGVVVASRQARANGRECIDDDECEAFSPCPYSADCTNTPGDYFCTCKPGYLQTGKTECQDINECANDTLNDCDPNARCENLDGSYRCRCKRGYRGDGRTCIPVGECVCFGDPHCISYDNRWLHFQGECVYVMSQDGCEDEGNRTFRVLVEHWKRGSERQGYYTWIKTVIVEIFGLEIRLEQEGRILVNGILVRQYYDQHRLSVILFNQRVQLKAVTGLELLWDFQDVIEITVPKNARDNVCGLCGNFNGNPDDDWEQGPACPENIGVPTDDFNLFGISWTVTESECEIDCTPGGIGGGGYCFYPQAVIDQECDKLMDLQISPFKDCLKVKTPFDRQEFRKSCVYDLCHVDGDLDAGICRFAEILSLDCSMNEKVDVKDWKSQVEACEETICPETMIYKECGPATQPTCLTDDVGPSNDVTACNEGCFCRTGQVMEGDQCIRPRECGCFYGNGYLATGDVIMTSDCSQEVECFGQNITTTRPRGCGENEECRTEEGVTGCYCKDGFIMDQSGECEPDNCHTVVCDKPNMECFNGTCVCSMGYIGDCNQCEDVDECATGTNDCNMIGQTCLNSDGSYTCICEDGFVPNGDNCKDIDECDYGIDNCGENAECVNILGGFLCECCAGYKKNGQGNCVRDTSLGAVTAACCACQGERCAEPGQVCGTDGKTYSNFRSLSVAACKAGDMGLAVNYKGSCKDSCDTTVCNKQYSTCVMEDGIPTCECPVCEDSASEYEDTTVCASNKVTYTSVCHMKAATCEADIETTVEVEINGRPCPDNGFPPAGPWGDWGPCSEECKQGTKNRTREVLVTGEGVQIHDTEVIPCYSTCDQGPCTLETCTGPGQVCMADVNNAQSCQCPECGEFPEEHVCGRVGLVIQTYLNECELEKEVCQKGEADYEVLEPRACEDKPVDCGLIRNYRVERDDNGCESQISINFGACYGGCDKEGGLCCYGNETGQKSVLMICPDGSSYDKVFDVITGCNCITKGEVDALKMEIVA